MSGTGPQNQPDEAMVDLLIKQATEGLSPAEQRALDVLDTAVASAYSRDFERAAAAIVVAGSAGAEPLPEALSARIEAQAQAFFAGVRARDRVVEFKTPAPAAAPAPRAPAGPYAGARRAAARGTAGWWVAAACLVLAILGWLRPPSPTERTASDVQVSRPPATAPASPPTLAQQRAALLSQPGSIAIPLGATQDPAAPGVTGDVVWNPTTQRGFLRFVGLPPNDPRLHQYQLWIFDGERDQRYPVDGGVFDVPPNFSEVLVPIRAEVPVHVAKAFAVTIEKPGGVVVSGREHIVALGQAS